MCKCKYCGKKVKQTPGKKERKYCNASCRQKHWQQKKREGKGIVKITQEEYERLLKLENHSVSMKELKEGVDFKIGSDKRYKIVNGKKVFK